MGFVLSLFDRSENWPRPYLDRGHEVRCVDLKTTGEDVCLLEFERKADVILAAPPCTQFAGSGARYWSKREDVVAMALANVDAVLRMVAIHNPLVWAIENPTGRLRRWLGPPDLIFNPCDYAGWADDPKKEAYTKRTCLWGRFKEPKPNPVEPELGEYIKDQPDSKDRAFRRSVTPTGFARAFALANPIKEIE